MGREIPEWISICTIAQIWCQRKKQKKKRKCYVENRLRLCDGVTSINAEICSGYVSRSIWEQKGNWSHQVFWLSHLTLWNEGDPLVLQIWVVIENLLGSEVWNISTAPCTLRWVVLEVVDLQSCEHVTWWDAVDSDASVGPFNCQTWRQMANGCLGCVVRCLWLGDVDNCTGHATDEDNASWGFAFHEVFGNVDCEKVSSEKRKD